MNIKDHINKLKVILNKHNIDYYVKDNPSISDSEYDTLLKELENLESKNSQFITSDSPTQRIGGKALNEFQTITHRLPMQSLANAMNQGELENFNNQISKRLNLNNIEYVGEPKLDGVAVELVYEEGKFMYGSTRGDGVLGEDITQNLKTIKAVPLSLNTTTIPNILEVRGEVFINHDDFKLLNKHRLDNGESPFSNPRNCAAGSLRQLDPKITMLRPLRIYCYAPGVLDGISFKTQKDFLDYLPELGFPVNPHIKIGKGLKFLKEYYHEAEGLRKKINYDIDGVVFKINLYHLQETLGIRSKSPRWAIAGKLTAQQATTHIIDIIISVGRTGALTPVAQLSPTKIGGVIVSNATLHNQDEIDRKDIRIGDTVLIQRAGDVIPEVVKVIKDKRSIASTPFRIPAKCPICSGKVICNDAEVVNRCSNDLCSAKIQGSIEHFVSKSCMNIDGLGTKIVELLIKEKKILDFGDLYTLTSTDIVSLNRMGEKSADNIIRSINKSKNSTLARFVNGLGIRNVGYNTAKILENYFKGDIWKLMNVTKKELTNIHEIGDIMSDSIINYFSNYEQKNIILKCLNHGIKFKFLNKIKQSIITEKVFVFTGNLGSLTRKDAIKLIESYGAKSSTSISSRTNYVIAGEGAGNKLKKAKKLDLKILNESQFLSLLKK